MAKSKNNTDDKAAQAAKRKKRADKRKQKKVAAVTVPPTEDNTNAKTEAVPETPEKVTESSERGPEAPKGEMIKDSSEKEVAVGNFPEGVTLSDVALGKKPVAPMPKPLPHSTHRKREYFEPTKPIKVLALERGYLDKIREEGAEFLVKDLHEDIGDAEDRVARVIIPAAHRLGSWMKVLD